MNEENEQEGRVEEFETVEEEFGRISKDEMKKIFVEDEEWKVGWS